jgi:hypothetical protein
MTRVHHQLVKDLVDTAVNEDVGATRDDLFTRPGYSSLVFTHDREVQGSIRNPG